MTRDLLPFIRATWREGLVMFLPFLAVAVAMFAACLEN